MSSFIRQFRLAVHLQNNEVLDLSAGEFSGAQIWDRVVIRLDEHAAVLSNFDRESPAIVEP